MRVPGETPPPTISQPTPLPSPTVDPTATTLPTPDFTQGTLTIWHSLKDEEIQTLVQVIADFQNIYPDTKFDVLYLPESVILERYIQAAQEGTGPVMLLGPANWSPTLVEAGLVKNISDLVDSTLTERINPAGLEVGRVGDFQAGLPYSLDGVVLFRNNKIILEASDTWEDLILNAQSTTEQDQVGAFLDRGFYYSGGHLLGIGGELMNSDGTPAFNSDKGLEWIDLLISFDQAGPTDFLTNQDLERFSQGLAGYVIETTSNRQALADQIGSQNLEIDRWPVVGAGRLSGFLTADLFYINVNTHPDSIRLAEVFGNYLLSAESQARLSMVGMIPSVVDAPVEDPLILEAVQALFDNVPYPTLHTIDLYRTALDQALLSIFNGSTTPEQALGNAEAVILESLSNTHPTPNP
jgi:maltose-binding protein MalE